MTNRRMLNLPQILKIDGAQEGDHPDQPHVPPTTLGASGSSPLVHPTVNIQGEPIPPSAAMPIGQQWSFNHAESGHNETEATGLVPNNHLHAPNPPSLNGQTSPTVAESFHNQTGGSFSHKRKNPFIPELYHRGPTSRYFHVGSSSNLHLPGGSYPSPWKYPPGSVLDSLSTGGEGTPRNVRSRGNAEGEPNAVWANSSNVQNLPFSSGQTNSLGFSGQDPGPPTTGLGGLLARASRGMYMAPGLFSYLPHLNTLGTLNGHSNGSVETVGFTNNGTFNLNTIPQVPNSTVNQSFGGLQIGRIVPTFGASSSNFHVTTPNEVHPPIADAEGYYTRYRQVLSALRLLNRDRTLRIGLPNHRFRIVGGQVIVDHTALYGLNNPIDQHRDMRLDVDNMSYEELLVLGERIGNVSTGLSEELISKCLTESILLGSPEQSGGDGKCVICLEEYKDMEELGNLKCGHDFHVGCIRKWLSMKNMCPICKTAAVDENNKEEEE